MNVNKFVCVLTTKTLGLGPRGVIARSTLTLHCSTVQKWVLLHAPASLPQGDSPPCFHQVWVYLREAEKLFTCWKSEHDSRVGQSADWSLYRPRNNIMTGLRKLWLEYGTICWQGYVSLLQSVLHSRLLGARNSEAVVSQTKFHSVRIQRGLDVTLCCSSRTVEGLPEETATLDGNCGTYEFVWYIQYYNLCGHNCAAWTSSCQWCRDPPWGPLGPLFNGFRELIVLW